MTLENEQELRQSYVAAVFQNYYPVHNFFICYFTCLGIAASGLYAKFEEFMQDDAYSRIKASRFSFDHHGTDYGLGDAIVIGFVVGGFVSGILFKIGLCSLALKGTQYEKSVPFMSWPILGGVVGFFIPLFLILFLAMPLWILSLGIERLFAVNPFLGLANSLDYLNFFTGLAIGPFIFSFVVPFWLEGHVRLSKARSTQQDD